jgi:thioredoxin 1
MALSITQDNFEKEIMQSSLPVVIDVYASWCGPCQQMMPIFHELTEELSSKYKFASINVDEARDISIKFGVTSVPTFIFIKNGQVVGKETGYMNKDVLRTKIESLLG